MLTVIQWEFQKYKYANDAQHTLFNNYFKNKTMFNKVIHINTNGVVRGTTIQNHQHYTGGVPIHKKYEQRTHKTLQVKRKVKSDTNLHANIWRRF